MIIILAIIIIIQQFDLFETMTDADLDAGLIFNSFCNNTKDEDSFGTNVRALLLVLLLYRLLLLILLILLFENLRVSIHIDDFKVLITTPLDLANLLLLLYDMAAYDDVIIL